jgi:hypothetical protein
MTKPSVVAQQQTSLGQPERTKLLFTRVELEIADESRKEPAWMPVQFLPTSCTVMLFFNWRIAKPHCRRCRAGNDGK